MSSTRRTQDRFAAWYRKPVVADAVAAEGAEDAEDAAAAEVVDAAIKVGAKAVWMQEGVVHHAAAAKARAAGLTVVMDRCLLKEHRKL